MTDQAGKQIVASPNPLHGVAPQAFRYAVTMGAAMLLSRLFEDGNIIAQGVALAGCVAPWIWGVVEKVHRNRWIIRLVPHAPDEIARFK